MNKPILYKTEMVQAIQQDRKTKTRRLKGLEKINENPDDWEVHPSVWKEAGADNHAAIFQNKETSEQLIIKMPWYKEDVLWVRETTRCMGFDDDEDEPTILIQYKDESSRWISAPDRKSMKASAKWKPSIFMLKGACRIFLKVIDVKLQRLQDISEEDAIAEGVEQYHFYKGLKGYENRYVNYLHNNSMILYARNSFETLWIKINGEESWNKNPWVWVIEFSKIEKPKDFLAK